MDPACWLWEKDPGFRAFARGNFNNISPNRSARPTTGCGATSASLWVHRNFFWQLSRDGNLRGSGMLNATTASLKPSFRGSWSVATPWSAEEMLDGQHQRGDILTRARTTYKSLLQKRLEEDLCWIVPRVLPTTESIEGLNWNESVVANLKYLSCATDGWLNAHTPNAITGFTMCLMTLWKNTKYSLFASTFKTTTNLTISKMAFLQHDAT